jgi:membrane associated rhomboid family serine protease
MATCYRHPDRETGLSCSECGRPICTDCMTVAQVGIRCPEHSGVTRTVRRPRLAVSPTQSYVTRALIAINVGIYLVELAGGSGILADRGYFFENGALYGPLVAHGDWWRLITSAFLHYGPLHLGVNMLALYWIGSVVEASIGHVRFVALYLASGLAGSAGALIVTPHGVTVGASGAIFGVLGSLLVLEWLATGSLAGPAMSMIVVNLAFSVGFRSNISLGGHIGGLIGGIACTYALARLRHLRSPYPGIAATVVVAAASVAIAYWKVRGLA